MSRGRCWSGADRTAGMLPIVVVSLALIFFVMKLSGVLDDLAAASRRREGKPVESKKARAPRQVGADPDPDRLRVFRDFIDRLPPPGDEPPSPRA